MRNKGWLILACLLAGAGCASRRPAVVVKQAGRADRIVQPAGLQPVNLSVEELRAGMAMLTANLPAGRSGASGSLSVCPVSAGPGALRLVQGPGLAGVLDAE